MRAFGSVEFEVRSLSADRVVGKLARAGVGVLSAENPRKNVVVLRVAARDKRKTFAILRGACYNIKNTRARGAASAGEFLVRTAGLFAGAVLFLAIVFGFQSRVLRIEVVGNGAYYEREILALLKEEGVEFLSPLPRSPGGLVSRILALPRVEFCSLKGESGILTVEVTCAEELSPLEALPLLSPVRGTLEELVVLRGTALAEVGASVEEGQPLVSAEGGRVVIAKARIGCSVEREYPLGREAALLQAQLDFGELSEVQTVQTETGWLVKGTAHITAASGLE